MENDSILKLKKTRSNILIEKAIYNYKLFLINVFIKNYDIMLEVCNYFDITEKELLKILDSNKVNNLSFLDEISQYTNDLVKLKIGEKEKNR